MAKRRNLKLHEMEAVFEDAITAQPGFEWAGQKIPEGWALIIDCEGDLVCAVPPGFIGDRGPTPGPAQEGDAADSLKRALVIAMLLNAARDYYLFADPDCPEPGPLPH